MLDFNDESRCSKSCKELFFAISIFVLIASWLSQMITVAIMRYRHAGKVCSGDLLAEDVALTKPEPYAWKSGKFMKVYLLITLSIVGTISCCGAIAGFAMCMTAARG